MIMRQNVEFYIVPKNANSGQVLLGSAIVTFLNVQIYSYIKYANSIFRK